MVYVYDIFLTAHDKESFHLTGTRIAPKKQIKRCPQFYARFVVVSSPTIGIGGGAHVGGRISINFYNLDESSVIRDTLPIVGPLLFTDYIHNQRSLGKTQPTNQNTAGTSSCLWQAREFHTKAND